MFNQKHEREKFDYRFSGMYRGIVVDVDDPKVAGRVRVRVHSVYDGVKDDALPWAQYADPFFMTGEDSGSQITPDVGNRVWLFFEEGDHMYPVFFAGAPSAKDLPSEATTTNRVIKTKKGHTVEIDDTDGNERIKLTHSTGTYLEMNDAGELGIDVVSNASLMVNGNSVEHITGNVTSTVGGNFSESIAGDVTGSVGGNFSESIAGDVTSTVGGNVEESIAGDATSTVGGNVEESIAGDATSTVGGNVEESIAGDVTSTVGGNVEELVLGDVTSTIEGNVEELVLGDATSTVGGNFSESIAGDATSTVDGNHDERIAGDVTSTVGGNFLESVAGDVTSTVEGNVEELVLGEVDITAAGVRWKAPTLDLGEGDLEPMVLGDKLAAWAESLVQWLDSAQVIGNLGAPTSVPIIPNQPTSEPAIFSGGNVYSTKNRTQ